MNRHYGDRKLQFIVSFYSASYYTVPGLRSTFWSRANHKLAGVFSLRGKDAKGVCKLSEQHYC